MPVQTCSTLFSGRKGTLVPLAVVAVVVAALTALPLAYLVLRVTAGGADSVLEVLRPRVLEVWLRSTLLAFLTAAASIGIGVPLAWLTSRSDLPARRFWLVATSLPLVIPSYVGAFALVSALGPTGVLRAWFQPFGIEWIPSAYSLFGAVLALTLLSYPYVLLTTRGGLLMANPRLEEAARTLGRSRWSFFFRVLLPLLRPSIAAGALLVALYSLSDFGAVSLLQYDSFTRVIYVEYRASFDRTAAAVLGLLLVSKTVALLAASRHLSGKLQAGRVPVTRPPRRPVPLGRWKWPAVGFCASVAALALGLPLSMIGFWLVRPGSPLAGLDSMLPTVLNSMTASGLAALLAVAVAFPVALLRTHVSSWWTRLLEAATYLGYALPGIVIALGLVFMGARHLPFLYQTLPLLVLAYLIRFLPQAVGSERGALNLVSPRVEEAALSLGASPWRVMTRVVVPLARPGLLSAFALVFLTSMKELPATLLLAPIGFETLATRIWSATSEGFFGEAALPALLLVAVSAASILVLVRERDELKKGGEKVS